MSVFNALAFADWRVIILTCRVEAYFTVVVPLIYYAHARVDVSGNFRFDAVSVRVCLVCARSLPAA